jgi:hypothetical protein
MNKYKFLAGLFSLVFLTGCFTVSTNSDYDTAVKFSNLKTFGWLPGPQPKTGDIRLDNTLLDERIRAAIDRELTAKGYRKIASGEPDFYVRYQPSVEGKIDVVSAPTPYYTTPYGAGYGAYGGYAGGWSSWGGSQTFVDQYDEGTIVVDFADPKTKKLIWRGTASAVVDPDANPAKREERINKAMAKLLKKFPPQ